VRSSPWQRKNKVSPPKTMGKAHGRRRGNPVASCKKERKAKMQKISTTKERQLGATTKGAKGTTNV